MLLKKTKKDVEALRVCLSGHASSRPKTDLDFPSFVPTVLVPHAPALSGLRLIVLIRSFSAYKHSGNNVNTFK